MELGGGEDESKSGGLDKTFFEATPLRMPKTPLFINLFEISYVSYICQWFVNQIQLQSYVAFCDWPFSFPLTYVPKRT